MRIINSSEITLNYVQCILYVFIFASPLMQSHVRNFIDASDYNLEDDKREINSYNIPDPQNWSCLFVYLLLYFWCFISYFLSFIK